MLHVYRYVLSDIGTAYGYKRCAGICAGCTKWDRTMKPMAVEAHGMELRYLAMKCIGDELQCRASKGSCIV